MTNPIAGAPDHLIYVQQALVVAREAATEENRFLIYLIEMALIEARAGVAQERSSA